MKNLNNEELLEVTGGGVISKFAWGIIGGAVVFLIGVIDGLVSPKKCN